MSAQAPTTRQILAQGLAKRRGISEEEAMAILQVLDTKEDADQFQTFMDRVKDNADTLRGLDSGTRSNALQFMAQAPAGGPGDDMSELKKMMREVTIIRETMRGDGGGSDLQKQLGDLQNQIKDMQMKEQAMKLDGIKTSFESQLKTLEEKLSGQISGLNPEGSQGSGITGFIDGLREFNEQKTALKEVLGETTGSGSSTGGLDAKQAAETLKKLGYKVEGPKTIEDIEHMMDDRVKKAVEEAVKTTTDKIKSDEKKMAMLVDLGSSMIDGFMPAITEGAGGEGVARGLSVAKSALKAVAPAK